MAPKGPDRDRIEMLTNAMGEVYGQAASPAAAVSGQSTAGSAEDQLPFQIVRAPGRVNLIGDHTEYNDGFVLPVAIELDTWIGFRQRRDGLVRVVSRHSRDGGSFRIDTVAPTPGRGKGGVAAPATQAAVVAAAPAAPATAHAGRATRTTARRAAKTPVGAAAAATSAATATSATATRWSDYIAGMAWSLREAGLPVSGFDGVVDTTIPIGSGLSSSSALEIAAASAMLSGGPTVSLPMLAALAQRAERDFVGVDCGIMDHMTSAAGREDRALLIDCRSLDTRYASLPFGVKVVVCDTGSRRDVHSSIPVIRRAECARAVALLSERMPGLCSLRDLDAGSLRRHRARLPENVARRAEHVVSENARTVAAAAALDAGNLDELGRLFAESHASLRDLYEVSSPALEAMVEVARAVPGVVASRMTGIGLGGCTVNLVLADAVPALQAAVARDYDSRTGLRGRVYPVAIVDRAGPVPLG